jgi:hypothetical protein
MTPEVESFAAEVSDFSLRGLKGLIDEYVPPPLGDFTPDGSWTHAYAMYVLIPRAARQVGEVSLTRKAQGSNGFTLDVHTRRNSVSGYSQFQRAEIQCKSDALASPVSWQFDTKLAMNASDPPYLESGRARTGAVRDGVLMIRDNIRTARSPLPGAYGNEWTLLEAVQRLPREKTPTMHYTLINEYDTPQPGHSLRYRDQLTVPLKSGPLKLHSYCDIGRAVIPTTYWVDEHNRLVFVCTGLQVYALNAANGRTGHCPPLYYSSHAAGPHYSGAE